MALDMGNYGFQVAESDMTSQQLPISMEEARGKLVVALDTPTVSAARTLVHQLNGEVGIYKVGLELLFGGGLDFAIELRNENKKVFLDMKLHDIGNTVEKAVANIAGLGFEFLTVHGVNSKILKAAVRGRETADKSRKLKLLAVTVLTDLDYADLREGGITERASDRALASAKLAHETGFDGVIASGFEARSIRAATDENFIIKVPGIRPANSSKNDQTRSMTPSQAIRENATYLVVGRPIYQSPNPAEAARQIVEEIRSAL